MKKLTAATLAAFLFLSNTNSAYASDNIFNRAFSFIGLHERTHRAQIQSVTKVDPVRVPWCAAFLNGILRMSGKPTTKSNKAISFAKYGSPTRSPKKGDIVVFRGHVGLFNGYTGKGRISVLGGNQSNKVKISTYSKKSVVTIRKI